MNDSHLSEEPKYSVQAPPTGGAVHFGNAGWEKLLRFAQLLESQGQVQGLVGPREMDKLWDRHLLNSTALLDFLPFGAELIDVGAGAGFPGIVIAAVRPDMQLYLVEPMERRVKWLEMVKAELNLSNVEIKRGRAEELSGKLASEFVTARAVAALRKLVPWTLPLVKSGGSLLALKGARAEEEIKAAHTQLRKYKAAWVDVHEVAIWGAVEGTRVVEIKKK